MKRKRGAQPGNRNARKHGFYSPALSPEQISAVWNAVNLKGIDPAVAVIRVKLAAALHDDPSNHRLLEDAAKLITKLHSAEVDALDARQFRAAVLDALDFSHGYLPAPPTPLPAGQNEPAHARIDSQSKSSLSTLEPRRRTNRDCQARMPEQDQSSAL